jgi:hypothetical protein
MGRALGVAAIALAACSEPTPGVLVDVEITSGSAELFLPVEACGMDCASGIRPPNGSGYLVGADGTGDVTYLDSTQRLIAASDGHHATIELRGDGSQLSVIYVVGYATDGTPTGFAEIDNPVIPTDHAERWRVELKPRTFNAPPAAGGDDSVWVWQQPTNPPYMGSPDHASCLGIQHADLSAQLYVPQDDADCDGVPTTSMLECDPYYYEFMSLQSPDAPCPLQVPLGSVSVCEIGHALPCVDGKGGGGCAPLTRQFCVPDEVCTVCGTTYTSGCVAALFMDPAITRLHCSFPTAVGGGPCPTNGNVTVSLANLGATPNTAMCSGAGFIAGQTINTPAPTFTVNGATFSVQSFSLSMCAFDISWTGVAQATDVGVSMFEIDFAVHRLALPIVLDFSGDCTTTTPECRLEPPMGTDHIWSCAQ